MMHYEGMKEANTEVMDRFRLFEFPLPGPTSPDFREAFYDFNESIWRWRDNGAELEYDVYHAIEAELARRKFERMAEV